MSTLRELHLTFRAEDRTWLAEQGEYLLHNDGDQRECRKGIRHDADRHGLCRWCGVGCDHPAPKPALQQRSPAGEHPGEVLVREAYEEHYDPDWGS